MRHLIFVVRDCGESSESGMQRPAPPPGPDEWHWLNGPKGPSGSGQKAAFRYAIDHGFDSITIVQPAVVLNVSFFNLLNQWLVSQPTAGLLVCRGPVTLRRLLTTMLCQRISGLWLREWQSPVCTYRTAALRSIAFELTNDHDAFEIEVALQLMDQGVRVTDDVVLRHDNGKATVPPSGLLSMLKACLKFRLQKINLFYDFRYHPAFLNASPYREKHGASSPHTFVCTAPGLIPDGAHVLDLGCATGYIANRLVETKGCTVTGIDQLPVEQVDATRFQYVSLNLEMETDRLCTILATGDFDVVLMLDVLEHLAEPELFLWKLYRTPYKKIPLFIFSTGNVAFWVVRIMLLLGYFNYGEKGILDITHKRLFSWRTFQNLFDQTGFAVQTKHYFPPPYAFLGFSSRVCRSLERIDRVLIRLRPSLFAYQILFTVRLATTLESIQPTLL